MLVEIFESYFFVTKSRLQILQTVKNLCVGRFMNRVVNGVKIELFCKVLFNLASTVFNGNARIENFLDINIDDQKCSLKLSNLIFLQQKSRLQILQTVKSLCVGRFMNRVVNGVDIELLCKVLFNLASTVFNGNAGIENFRDTNRSTQKCSLKFSGLIFLHKKSRPQILQTVKNLCIGRFIFRNNV